MRRAGRRALAGDEQDVRCLRVLHARSRSRPGRAASAPWLLNVPCSSRTRPRAPATGTFVSCGARHRAGRRRLRVVAAAQVRVDLVAAPGAELVAGGVEQQRVADLGAAALAEVLGLDRVQRVDVAAVDRSRVGAVAAVPEVDAREVGVDVVQHLHALGAGGLHAAFCCGSTARAPWRSACRCRARGRARSPARRGCRAPRRSRCRAPGRSAGCDPRRARSRRRTRRRRRYRSRCAGRRRRRAGCGPTARPRPPCRR